MRYGVTARRKRNVGRLERLAGLRQQKRDARRATGEVKIVVSEADLSGKMVVEAKDISKAYDGRTLVARFLDPHHPRRPHRRRRRQRHRQDDAAQDADRRARRPTAARSASAPTSSSRASTSAAQSSRADSTLKEALTGGGSDTLIINGAPKHVIGYMQDFLFTPEQARTAGRKALGRRTRPPGAGARPGAALATSSSSTSPPTISTSKPSTCCRRCSPTIPAPSSSSPTTATSSTASRPP